MQNTTTEKRKITTQQMALVAIMTALTCIMAPFHCQLVRYQFPLPIWLFTSHCIYWVGSLER